MKAYWVAGIVMTAGLHAQTQNCIVDVYVLVRVPMRAGMLTDAKKKTTAMFKEIGVDVRMRTGVPTRDLSDTCGAPILLQLEDAVGYRGNEEALAYALPHKQFGTCVHIFLDRVLSQLNRDPAFANTLLAHVMAHEVTHVLERIERHSPEGLMKAAWSERDYARMKDDPLPFAPEDVELIRQGLAWRAHAATEGSATVCCGERDASTPQTNSAPD